MANGKERGAWVKGHEAVLSLSFYMIHVSQRALQGLWVGVEQNTNKYKMEYIDHADAKAAHSLKNSKTVSKMSFIDFDGQ